MEEKMETIKSSTNCSDFIETL